MSQNYSGNAVADVLDASMTSNQTTATIADGTGWPTSNFVATIHRGEVNEEQIYVTTRSGTALSGITRGYAGSTAYAHDANEAIEHTADAVSFQRWEDHIADTDDAHDATAISFSPTGTIAATTVQAAVAEVSGDVTTLDSATTSALAGKAATSHSHVTGDITSLAEFIRDTMATALAEGSGIGITVDDPGDTITIAVTDALPATAGKGLLGYATTTTDFSTSTTGSDVDVTDLSVAVTVEANRLIRITCVYGWANNALALIKEGSTTLGKGFGASWGSTPSSPTEHRNVNQVTAIVASPSAGAHTYKVAVRNFTASGSCGMNFDAEFPGWIIVEDIGPA